MVDRLLYRAKPIPAKWTFGRWSPATALAFPGVTSGIVQVISKELVLSVNVVMVQGDPRNSTETSS